ncbi:hypothetical protein CHS0354_026884 [Potamilus streckersoni]|uniref:Uncharacterized protein n=1 Tax=Potamilus streckersoni TaxID=2493646 RepID=A0AAE0W070_9BIVA|nr:hypothetical protein CHS0354_026884 [Potamilus streckersoni]
MDQRAIDIVVTDSDGAVKAQSVRKHSMWRKINEKLQDNRLSGRRDADKILDCENPEKYKCLKRVLNIAFLSIGVTLLISVVAVIIYSSIVGGK